MRANRGICNEVKALVVRETLFFPATGLHISVLVQHPEHIQLKLPSKLPVPSSQKENRWGFLCMYIKDEMFTLR